MGPPDPVNDFPSDPNSVAIAASRPFVEVTEKTRDPSEELMRTDRYDPPP